MKGHGNLPIYQCIHPYTYFTESVTQNVLVKYPDFPVGQYCGATGLEINSLHRFKLDNRPIWFNNILFT